MSPTALCVILLTALAHKPPAIPTTPRTHAPSAPAAAPATEPTPAPVPAPVEAPVPVEPAHRTMRVAVYDLELSGVEPRIGRVVTDALVAEIRKLQRISVIGMAEIRAMLDLEAQKQLSGCADDSCLAQIADALGVDAIVIGSLARIGDEHVIGIRVLDQREAKAVGTVTQRLEAQSGEEFLAVIGPGVEELFPNHLLRPGATRGVAEGVALSLNPPPLPSWVFYSAAVLSSLLVGATAGAAAFNLYTVSRLDALVASEPPVKGADLKARREELATTGVATWALLGGSAIGLSATGVIALFTDWTGARDLAPE